MVAKIGGTRRKSDDVFSFCASLHQPQGETSKSPEAGNLKNMNVTFSKMRETNCDGLKCGEKTFWKWFGFYIFHSFTVTDFQLQSHGNYKF